MNEMTESVLTEIVHRAVRDGSFRAQLKSDPAGALAGFSRTSEERSAIASGDPTRLTALGIDQRMSKAFTVGVAGDASKVIVVDAGAGGATVLDEAATAHSPLWRIEQDLDTAATDAVIAEPATEHSPLWRIERDLDVGGTASAAPIDGSPEAAAFEAAPAAFGTGSAAPIDGSPEASALESAAATDGTEATQVEDLNQNYPGDTHLSEY